MPQVRETTQANGEVGDTDIAIVGMAARVPGGRDYRSFWRNLRDGVESISPYTGEELLAAGEDPEALRRKNYVRAGAPIEGMENFDGEFFGFSPKDCAILDPQHRHFLECAWEAFEDAGHPPDGFAGQIGVFAGSGMGSYFYFNLCSNPDLVRNVGMFLLRHTGNDKDFLATRLSYLFNLTGPSLNVQTACSTSLVAVHLACQSLIAGECDMALAGGVTIELPHRRGYLFRENEILSPDGHCHAFDHRAQGTVFGSGAGVVVLRRLEAALRDGDHVHAVIRGSAVNNDGAGKAGYLAPSVDGQASAVVEALGLAGVDPRTVGYVECHGTGTYLGDPIEVEALTQAYRQSTDAKGFCLIGSVKTNIGHLDTAAGVIGLIKASLALENQQIPPSLNFERPNPTIDFASSPFQVNAALTEWPRGNTPRRAGVNSLGVGGTNAHVVLEEAPARSSAAPSASAYQLLALSARNRPALDDACDRLALHLETHPEVALADVAYTLKVGRRAFSKRRVLACSDREEAIALLRSADPTRVFTHAAQGGTPSLYFMLPGGGAQYPDMARDLYEAEPLFRETVDRGLRCLDGKIDYDPRQVLFPAPDRIEQASLTFQRPSVQLPAIFIIEYALAKMLMARGIVPKALIGHSLGENTAACLAEVLSFEEGVDLVRLRGTLFDGVAKGGMLSVPLPRKDIEPLLGHELDLACVNSPGLCVVSGPQAALEALQRRLAAADITAHRVNIDIAAHSRMVDGILQPFRAHLKKLDLKAPKIPFISNLTGRWIEADKARDPEYWVQHLRNTVHFADGIATLAADPAAVFIEVGPGKTLGSLAKQNPTVSAQSVIATLRHPEERIDDRAFLQTVFGRLWALGLDLPAKLLWPGEKRRRVPLPTYAFQGQRYWIEPGRAEAVGYADGSSLPAKLPDIDRWFSAPSWKRRDPDAVPDDGPRTWLVFQDETDLGARLVERLRARGEEVITVRAGDAFYKVDDHQYWLSPEHGADGYRALVRDLLASGKAPSRVVHMWLLSDGETFRPGSTFFHRNQERGFYSLLFFAQALASEEHPQPLALSIVSRGMQQVAGGSVPYPEQATVLGPCKVMPREFPGMTCKSIDLAPSRVPDATRFLQKAARGLLRFAAAPEVDPLEALLVEISLAPETALVALRGRERWVERIEPVKLADGGSRPLVFRRRGVYLITGGLGGIGVAAARMLAREHQARLVLINRVPLPARQDWERWIVERPGDPVTRKIRAALQLEAAGAEVLICAGDVADADRMTEIVAEAKARFGAVHGAIHAAGVLDDALIAAKRQASVENVFGPKVYGTLVLDRVLAAERLDFLLLFSSTSTVVAAAGQVDYVAANAFLNNYAAKARGEGRPVQAVSWGIWAEIGMAASAAQKLGLGEALPAAARPASPLYQHKQAEAGRGGILAARWEAASTWCLDEHRTADRQAVLPGTGYLELCRAALREMGETGPFEVHDLFFFRPLHVADDRGLDVRVRLKPTDEGYGVEVQSRYEDGQGAGGFVLHGQAGLRIGVAAEAGRIDLGAIEGRCARRRTQDSPTGLRLRQEDHLCFGPRWRVLRQASFGADEALGRLELAERFAGDLSAFGLHPALLDIATGFALEMVESNDDDALWVPVSYRRVRVHADLPQRIRSWVRLGKRPAGADVAFAIFDVTIADEDGQTIVEVEGLTMRRLDDDAFALARPPTASEIEPGGRGRDLSPGELAFQHNLSQGITQAEGLSALARVLQHPERGHVIVSSMDLGALVRQAGELAAVPHDETNLTTMFSRPQLESEFVAPRTDVEKTLVGFWESLLGVNQVGVRDSFFELGGHSLIAVRLFAKIKKTYNVDYPISVLFTAPTVEACAKLIAEAIGGDRATTEGAAASDETHRTRYTHLVAMHTEGTGKAPFLLVAGMFGNVLNLRHLAHLVGADRPFYGLQARGLYGDQTPHESFEETARDYLREVKMVQPHGPYLLGGFSGGGITAYEMARQLLAEGEEVSLVVMLDTPLPNDEPLTPRDKLAIHQQNLAKEGPMYVVNWARNKWKYRQHLQTREQERQQQEAAKIESKIENRNGNNSGHDFHSRVIEAAFYRAAAQYEVRELPLHAVLFRPRLRPTHQLGPGRAINADRRLIYHDNGWAPFVRRMDVFEVPGDHDSMVLEPNVRVLAVRLRECLEQAARREARPERVAGRGQGEGRHEHAPVEAAVS